VLDELCASPNVLYTYSVEREANCCLVKLAQICLVMPAIMRTICLNSIGCLLFSILSLLPMACVSKHVAGPLTTSTDPQNSVSSSISNTPLGSTLTSTGVIFRVWAPNADKVFVAGDFNGFSDSTNELVRSGDIFSGEVAGAHAGQNYRYVILQGGEKLSRIDPRARQMSGPHGTSVIVDPSYQWHAQFASPPINQMVIYELHIGSFNPLNGQLPGNFASVSAKLDDLAELGVNMIELLPVHENLRDIDWGYGIDSPFALEHTYGNPNDLRALVDAAHARGIGIILDVVFNHCARNNDLICYDGQCLGLDGIYFYANEHGFTRYGPRPDFGRSQIHDFIVGNLAMYLDEYKVDGFRWDAAKYIRRFIDCVAPDCVPGDATKQQETDNGDNASGQALLRTANDWTHTHGAISIAEDFERSSDTTNTTSQGGLGFDSRWDAFHYAINSAVAATMPSDIDLTSVANAILQVDNDRGSHRLIFTESHDEVGHPVKDASRTPIPGQGQIRIPARIDATNPTSLRARKRSTLGAAMVMTAPGIPMIFQGQEFLESQTFAFPNGTFPMWTNEISFSGIRNFYRDLIRIRRNLAGYTRGLTGDHVAVFHQNDNAKVLAFHRWDTGGPGDDVVVVANFGEKSFFAYDIGLPSGGTWKARLSSDSMAYGNDYTNSGLEDVIAQPQSKDKQPYKGTLSLASSTAVILSQ